MSKVEFKNGHVLFNDMVVGRFEEKVRFANVASDSFPTLFDSEDWDEVPDVDQFEFDVEVTIFEHGMPYFLEIGRAAPDDAFIYGYHDGISFLCTKHDIENSIPSYTGTLISWDRASYKNVTVEWPIPVGLDRVEGTRDGDLIIVNDAAYMRLAGTFKLLERKPSIIL